MSCVFLLGRGCFGKRGRFWFNYAARMCLDIDDLYWQALHDRSDGDCAGLDDDATRAEVESLVRLKMGQRNPHGGHLGEQRTE